MNVVTLKEISTSVLTKFSKDLHKTKQINSCNADKANEVCILKKQFQVNPKRTEQIQRIENLSQNLPPKHFIRGKMIL